MEHRDQMILRRIGKNIKHGRIEAGMTQEAVGGKAGMYATQIARMERGENDSGITKFLKVAWAMDMPPAQLFDRLEERMP